jgi:hypothetical protein
MKMGENGDRSIILFEFNNSQSVKKIEKPKSKFNLVEVAGIEPASEKV